MRRLATLMALLLAPSASLAQVPVPTVTGPVTGPGQMFPGLREAVPGGTGVEASGYEAREFFVSGTAAGKPYTTRIVVRAPRDARRASGIVVAEPMHGSGNSWMFFMSRLYMMDSGHVHVEIAAQKAPTEASIVAANPERYKTLSIPDAGQVNEIIAQVGALLKSSKPAPLAGLTVRRVVLMGTSQSAGVLRGYLALHATHRLQGGGPIYDGYYPTSTAGDQQIVKVDVPLVHLATQNEVHAAAPNGNKYRREDGDEPGNQYRLYEMAGMPHNDSRENPNYRPDDPCINPSSRFPVGSMMAVGLEHLVRWVDKGIAPPRAPRVEIAGGQMALDEHGNVKGGVRNTYVDVPTTKIIVPNKGKPGLPPAQRADFYCNITGYEEPMSAEALKKLYGDKRSYERKVEARLRELTKQGWFLPVYERQVLEDAKAVSIR